MTSALDPVHVPHCNLACTTTRHHLGDDEEHLHDTQQATYCAECQDPS